MKKHLAGAFLLTIPPFLAFAAAAAPPSVPPDGIKIDKNPKQVVIFNHSTHDKEMQCDQCHHMVDGKDNSGKCFDAGCHDNMNRKDKSPGTHYNVIHAKSGAKFSTCVSCHIEIAAKAPARKKELTACKRSRCHPS